MLKRMMVMMWLTDATGMNASSMELRKAMRMILVCDFEMCH